MRESVAGSSLACRTLRDPDFRMKAFKTDGWSFRWTATGVRAYQLGVFPKPPFYDARIAELFGALPTEYVRERRLQVGWLKGHAPELARITWQAHDARTSTCTGLRRLCCSQSARRSGGGDV